MTGAVKQREEKVGPGVVRLDDAGDFDEFVVKRSFVHLEMMDDGLLWGAFERNGKRAVIWISAAKKGRLSIRVEDEP